VAADQIPAAATFAIPKIRHKTTTSSSAGLRATFALAVIVLVHHVTLAQAARVRSSRRLLSFSSPNLRMGDAVKSISKYANLPYRTTTICHQLRQSIVQIACLCVCARYGCIIGCIISCAHRMFLQAGVPIRNAGPLPFLCLSQ